MRQPLVYLPELLLDQRGVIGPEHRRTLPSLRPDRGRYHDAARWILLRPSVVQGGPEERLVLLWHRPGGPFFPLHLCWLRLFLDGGRRERMVFDLACDLQCRMGLCLDFTFGHR